MPLTLWKSRSSEKILLETPLFNICQERMGNSSGSIEHDFLTIRTDHWANIIPLTENREVVFVSQYRHGTRALSLEIPGGIVEAETIDPRECAWNELREETGYTAPLESIVHLGSIHPNPAIQDNTLHLYFAPEVKRSGIQELDSTEEIEVSLVPLKDVPGLIRSGRITHSAVICAFFHYALTFGWEFS